MLLDMWIMRTFKIITKLPQCARCVYYLSEITTRTSNLRNTVLVSIDFQSNAPKRPQSTANDVEGVEYRCLHHLWILISLVLVSSHSFCTSLDLQLKFIALCVITIELTAIYCSVYILQVPYQLLAHILILWYHHLNVGKNSCHDLIHNPRM